MSDAKQAAKIAVSETGWQIAKAMADHALTLVPPEIPSGERRRFTAMLLAEAAGIMAAENVCLTYGDEADIVSLWTGNLHAELRELADASSPVMPFLTVITGTALAMMRQIRQIREAMEGVESHGRQN